MPVLAVSATVWISRRGNLAGRDSVLLDAMVNRHLAGFLLEGFVETA